jgi:uncharacterized protein (DUF58 family)
MYLPTRRFALIFILLLLLVLTGIVIPGLSWLGYLSAFFFLSALAAEFFLLPSLADFDIHRSSDPYLSIGNANRIGLSFDYRGSRKIMLQIRDEYPITFVVENDDLRLEMDAHSRAEVEYLVKPLKKGEYSFERVFFRIKSSLQLLQKQYSPRFTHKAVVYPDIISLKKYLNLLHNDRLAQIGIRKPVPGGENEFSFMKEYQDGDDWRRISWKAMAKRQYPVVRIFEKEYNRNVVALLDAGRMMTSRYDALTKLDHAINVSLILGASVLQKHDRFGVLSFSNEIQSFVAPEAEKNVLTSILDALCRVEAEYEKTDYVKAYTYLSKKIRRNSIIFVFSELFDRVVSNDLMKMLVLLSRHHKVFVISFEEVEELVNARNREEIARWAVQQQGMLEKESMLRELQKRGVKAIQVNAENIQRNVINAYLSA